MAPIWLTHVDRVNHNAQRKVILAGAARGVGAAQSPPQLGPRPQRGAHDQPLRWAKALAIVVTRQALPRRKGNWS